MTKTTIRRALPADAATVAELGARTFADTFGHLYPPQDLAAFVAEAHAPEKVASEIADPATGVWLAERDGEAIGYAVAGPCSLPHPDVTPACGELKRIYLDRAARGGGVGGRLMQTALGWLEGDGARRLWIGVWSQNLGAQRLYERAGFRKVGEYGFRVGGTVDREFILARP